MLILLLMIAMVSMGAAMFFFFKGREQAAPVHRPGSGLAAIGRGLLTSFVPAAGALTGGGSNVGAAGRET